MIERAVKLTLREIKYDVKFDTWLAERLANRLLRNANPEAEKIDYAYKDDTAEDWLLRQVNDAIDRVYGELRWCVIETEKFLEDTILSDDDAPSEWTIGFRFDDHWKGSMRAIRGYLHVYIREYILSMWYREAMPDHYAEHSLAANDALESLRNEARSGRVVLPPWTI